jgi:hypothetical protein
MYVMLEVRFGTRPSVSLPQGGQVAMRNTAHPTAEKGAASIVDNLVEEIVATYHRAGGRGPDLIRWLKVDAGEYRVQVDGLLRGWYGIGGPPELDRLVAAARGAGYGPDRCARFIGDRFGLEQLPERGIWAVKLRDTCPNHTPTRDSGIERQLELLLPIPIWAEGRADAHWPQALEPVEGLIAQDTAA